MAVLGLLARFHGQRACCGAAGYRKKIDCQSNLDAGDRATVGSFPIDFPIESHKCRCR